MILTSSSRPVGPMVPRSRTLGPVNRRDDRDGPVGPRVVSLVPSITETLSAWGVEPVACTRYCERPDLVHVGGTKNPDLDAIVALHPDLVVLDAEENRREDYDELIARGVTVHATRVTSLSDVDPTLEELARRVGATWQPETLASGAPATQRAYVPIWRRPWRALGPSTYGASLLAHLAIAVAPDDAGPYPCASPHDVAGVVERVIAPSEPYPFAERHRRELEVAGPVTFVDGRDLFWWGVRTRGAIARLARVVDIRGATFPHEAASDDPRPR